MSSGKALPRARPAARDPQPVATSPSARGRRRSASVERRRREQHFARRRRDLFEDCVLALVLTILILSTTAGLGVVALLEVPLGAAVIGSLMAERVIRRRHRRDRSR